MGFGYKKRISRGCEPANLQAPVDFEEAVVEDVKVSVSHETDKILYRHKQGKVLSKGGEYFSVEDLVLSGDRDSI